MRDVIRRARTLEPDAAPGQIDDPAERDRLAGFLAAGTAILATTQRVRDVFAPERGEVVPISVRSDGVWVWSDAHAYYVAQHGIAPEPDFYEHIRAQGYRCRRLDADEADRTLEAFYSST